MGQNSIQAGGFTRQQEVSGPVPSQAWRQRNWLFQSAHGKRETFGLTNQTVYYQNSLPVEDFDQAEVYVPSYVPATGIIVSLVCPSSYDTTNRYVPKDEAGANLTPTLLQACDQPFNTRGTLTGSGDITGAVNSTYSVGKEEGVLVFKATSVTPRKRTDGVTTRGAHFQIRIHGPTTVPCVSAVDGVGGTVNQNGSLADFNAQPFKSVEGEEDSFGGYAGGNQTLTAGTWSGAHGNGYQAAGVMIGVSTRGRPARSVLCSGDSLETGYMPAEADTRANLDGYGRRAVRLLRKAGYIASYISDCSTTTRSYVYQRRSDWKIKLGLCTDWIFKPVSVNDLGSTNGIDSPAQPALTLSEIQANLANARSMVVEAVRKGIRVYLVYEPFFAGSIISGVPEAYAAWFSEMRSWGIPIIDMSFLYGSDGQLLPKYRTANYPTDTTHTNSLAIDHKAALVAAALLQPVPADYYR